MIEKYESIKKLATQCLTETLHGNIPVKTTMKLAEGVLALIDDLENLQVSFESLQE